VRSGGLIGNESADGDDDEEDSDFINDDESNNNDDDEDDDDDGDSEVTTQSTLKGKHSRKQVDNEGRGAEVSSW
jgi:hypothetical protein